MTKNEAAAIGFLVEDPTLTDSSIARLVGADASRVSRWENFQRVAAIVRKDCKVGLPPPGSKVDGWMEAIDYDSAQKMDEMRL